ncbi:MAG: SMP-30/gluconolactonase/LRE family protein [Polyangiaceae bacterium]
MRSFTRWVLVASLSSWVSLVACDAREDGQGGSGGATASSGDATSTGEASSAGGTTAASTSSAATSSSSGPQTFLDVYPLDAQYPEGGIYDPKGHAFYVGSLGDGSVHRVDAATGAETLLFHETAPGTWWTLGMDVDTTRERLWVCAMDDSVDPRAGYVWLLDRATGKRILTYDLSTAAPDASCTDVVVSKNGTAYVCDREAGRIYVMDEQTAPTVFVEDDALSASFVGQNAMVLLPDESAILSLLYLPSGLARVDLSNGVVTPVDVSGKFPDLTPLHGADGMTYANGSLYVAFTEELIRLDPVVADWTAAASQVVVVPNGQTDVISTPNGLDLLNGQSVTFALGDTPDPFHLVKFTGNL